MAESTLHRVLLQIAKKENFKSPKIAIDESPNHGYLANVHRITLKDDETDQELHLFVKEKPTNVNENWHVFYVYEAIFYNNVIKAFQEVVTKSEPTLPMIPKCYFASEDIIVLEDLLENKHKLWNPLRKPLDSEHIKVILEAYGKFHAFSFALKHKHLEKFTSIGPKYEYVLQYYQNLKDSGYFDNLIEKLSNCFDPETESEYIKAISEFYGGKQIEYLQRLIDSDKTDVFVHGDNWVHNYMFKYDGNKPTNVCLLDYQIFRRTSPVVDLSYFLAACACTEEAFNSIWDYLNIYHASLEKHLSNLNCPKDVYTWETLKEEWLKFSLKGLSMSAMITKMIVADKDELALREDIPIPLKFDFISRNEEMYKKRMRILIKYFYNVGAFNI